jgi:hypothetical protein
MNGRRALALLAVVLILGALCARGAPPLAGRPGEGSSFGLVTLTPAEALLTWDDGAHAGLLKLTRQDFDTMFGPVVVEPLTPKQQRRARMGQLGFGDVSLGADYSDEQRQFMLAMEAFKRRENKPFPTCCDILRILKDLGYRKVAPPTAVPGRQERTTTARRRL